jgi:hypothetical protein
MNKIIIRPRALPVPLPQRITAKKIQPKALTKVVKINNSVNIRLPSTLNIVRNTHKTRMPAIQVKTPVSQSSRKQLSLPTIINKNRNQIQRTAVARTRIPIGAEDVRVQKLKDIGLGRILVMIAPGPSILEADLAKLKDHPYIDIMCINKPQTAVWPSKFWGFCDHTQYTRNEETWNNYEGMILNSPNVTARKANQVIIKTKQGKGFSKDLSTGYYIGRSSTYANMQAAYYMNYEIIYIFGLDMTEVNGKLHSYGVNPDVSPENRKSRFAAEAEHYLFAGQNLPEDIRKKFIICSSYNPYSFVDYFGRLDQKTAVDTILEAAKPRNKNN